MSITVLIIEDDLIIAHGLKENLEELGYSKVLIAINSDEALNISQNESLDLCLVDITLGASRLDGIDLVCELQKEHTIPYIYLTSLEDEISKGRAKKTNPAAYLIKPSSKSQIAITIDIAMSTHFRFQKMMESAVQPFLSSGKDRVFVKTGDRYQRIELAEVIYLQADGSYCRIHTLVKTFTISLPLGKVIEQLENPDIIRTHKTYAVNENHISSFDQLNIYIEYNKQTKSIPISRSRKEQVHKRLHTL